MPTLIAQTARFPAATRRLPPGSAMRHCLSSDIPALGQLYFAAYPAGVAEATIEDSAADIAATFDGSYGELWPEASPVVETAGKLVCAVLTVRRAPWDDTPECPFIIEVFTAREHRRRGLARAALTHVAAVVCTAGEKMMAVRNVASREFPMPTSVERFFAGYVEAFNRSLGASVDVAGIRSHFSPCFVAAGPNGVNCGQNDDAFADTLQQGYAFYTAIGTKAMALRGVSTTPIDDAHQMAKVDYRATYERRGGEAIDLDFAVISMLAARDDTFEIFAFVAGDEMALYREHGLLPDENP